jgi:hypothetical protein
VPARSGSRVIDPLRAHAWLGKDFGEDWVVPKSEVRYLVTRRVERSMLFTAYGPDGQLIGERLFADAAAGSDMMRHLSDARFVEEWRDIPDEIRSATRFLDGGPSPR